MRQCIFILKILHNFLKIREVISVQVGQSGNIIANEFWNQIRKEHEIDDSGNMLNDSEENIPSDVYFQNLENSFIQS